MIRKKGNRLSRNVSCPPPDIELGARKYSATDASNGSSSPSIAPYSRRRSFLIATYAVAAKNSSATSSAPVRSLFA
jgi:hypothetical protein